MFHPKGPTLGELIRQALSSTERGYDLLAPKFEYTPFRTPDAILKVAAERIGEVDDALDLCCGTGAALRYLLPYTRGHAVGVDLSQGMLNEAQKRLEGLPTRANVQLVRADALVLPFENAFDVVVSFGAFGHILEEDEPALVASVKRVLRPGGRFLFVTGEAPSAWSPTVLMARGFNAAMRVRNRLIKPEFVMYYLTFLLPRACELLQPEGFRVEVTRDVFPHPWHKLVLVEATLGA